MREGAEVRQAQGCRLLSAATCFLSHEIAHAGFRTFFFHGPQSWHGSSLLTTISAIRQAGREPLPVPACSSDCSFGALADKDYLGPKGFDA
jgi:hypothetical protein